MILQGCSERRVDPGIRRTRAAAAGASGWTDSPPLLRRRSVALIGPGLGVALPSRPDGASSGDCPPPPPARAGERQCPPARTVQAAGDSDQVRSPPRRQPAALLGPGRERRCPPARTVQAAGDSDCGPTSPYPPPSPARAWDRQCHPARTVPRNAGGSGPVRRPPVATCLPHRPGPGSDFVLPPGRCKSQVTRTAGRRRRTRRPHRRGPGAGSATPPGRCPAVRETRVPRSGRRRRPAALTGPGRGATLSSRPDGARHR